MNRLSPSPFKPRRQNSGKQHEGKRFPSHLQWIRGRPCILADRPGHVCNSKIRACHVDDAGGKGMSLKVADYHTVPGCDCAHDEMHAGAQTFQSKYKIILADAAKQYAKASPHRNQWEQHR